MTFAEKKKKIENLKKKIAKVESEYNYNKAMQLALKLVINGTYGAFAHPKFVVSNKDIANAITAHGRDVILFMLNKIEKYFYEEWYHDIEVHKLLEFTYIVTDDSDVWYMMNNRNRIIGRGNNTLHDLLIEWNVDIDKLEEHKDSIKIEDKIYNIKYKRHLHNFVDNVEQIDGSIVSDREKMPGFSEMTKKDKDTYDTKFHKDELCVYGDTDSVDKDSVIITNNGEKTIEEFYNENTLNVGESTLKGHESVKTGEKILNWCSEKKLYYAPVKRVIRHKVIKQKWKIKIKTGEEIFVTNDHSMIVFRDGEQFEVKPSEMKITDKILRIYRDKDVSPYEK